MNNNNSLNMPPHIQKSIVLITLIVAIAITVLPMPVAEVECPFGLINDTAPGQCGRYIDVNTNSICDLSEPHACNDTAIANPEGITLSGEDIKTMNVYELAQVYAINADALASALSKELSIRVTAASSMRELHDNYGLKMARAKEIALMLGQKAVPQQNTTQQIIQTQQVSKKQPQYNLISIAIITILVYSITSILAYTKKITLAVHRKIWNWILLISFIATTLFALIWLINIDYQPGIRVPFNASFWHIETGIVMIIVSVFHAWWHVAYYIRR